MAQLKSSNLKERCERLQRQLVTQKLITPAELKDVEAQRPRSRDDWWERYAVLKSYARRIEWQKEKQAAGTQGDISRTDAEAQRIRMLLAEPVSVMLDDGKKYDIYPKSYNALVIITSVDYAIAWLDEMAAIISEKAGPEAPGYLPRIAEQIGHLQNIMCSIILHKGPGYDQKYLEWPNAYDFSPMDMLTLQKAFNEVNVVRMMALPKITEKKSDKPGKSTGWSDFFVIMGMARRVDPASLMNDQPLIKLLAEASIKSANSPMPDGDE